MRTIVSLGQRGICPLFLRRSKKSTHPTCPDSFTGVPLAPLASKVLPLQHSRHLLISGVDGGGMPKRDRAGRHILRDRCIHGDETVGTDLDKVAQRGVDAEKDRVPIWQWPETTNMRGKIGVILDDRAVADVVAAPQIHIVAEPAGWLHGLIFQDETVLADDEIRPSDRLRTDIGREPVAGSSCLCEFFGAQSIESTVGQRDEHVVIAGRKTRGDFAPCDDRKTFDFRRLYIGIVDGEAHDFVGAVVLEIEARKARHFLGPNSTSRFGFCMDLGQCCR